MNYFTVINLNASRIANVVKLGEINDFISDYKPDVLGIQEVNISAALKVFSGEYQVYCNIESNAKDGVGIVSLVKHGIRVDDIIVGNNGRMLGLSLKNAQIWTVYPKSGTGFKKERETFFREEFNELFIQW